MRHAIFGLGSFVVLMMANMPQGTAAPRPWCLVEGDGIRQCLYATFQQCYESSRGVGGSCLQNPSLAYPQSSGQRQTPPRRRD